MPTKQTSFSFVSVSGLALVGNQSNSRIVASFDQREKSFGLGHPNFEPQSETKAGIPSNPSTQGTPQRVFWTRLLCAKHQELGAEKLTSGWAGEELAAAEHMAQELQRRPRVDSMDSKLRIIGSGSLEKSMEHVSLQFFGATHGGWGRVCAIVNATWLRLCARQGADQAEVWHQLKCECVELRVKGIQKERREC